MTWANHALQRSLGRRPTAIASRLQSLRPVEDRTKVWLHRSADAAGSPRECGIGLGRLTRQ